tara:strand:+ start:307 stop:513 length:207 start_codon:yes stop_codon:yes gene_type:complete
VFFHIYFIFLYFKYFKKYNIEIVKNNNPITLVSGHIAKDLNVGDKNIENDKIKSMFLSIFSNLNNKHL